MENMSRSIRAVVATAAIAGLALSGCARDSDVPAYDDIEGQMWESMAASEAMGMTGVLPDEMASDREIIVDMLGADLSELQIYGPLDGSATAIRLGDDEDPIMTFFGDEVYVSWDMMWEVLTSSMMTGASEADIEEVRQNTADFEGKYIDVSENYASMAESVNMADLLEQMRSAAEADQTDEVTGFNFGELQQEGDYMRLDMETDDTGWFYSTDGQKEGDIMNGEAVHFIGLVTDREAPRMVEMRNGDDRMDFTWDDEVDIPEKPSEDQLITEEDLMAAAAGQ
ncbi:hypothetical protein GCM10022249_23230 [Enteractinococcus coprophilus]